MKERINVTKTFLPPLGEYEAYLKQIWESGQLTNQGPLLKEFETRIKEWLEVDAFHFVSNGTIALQIAIKALDIVEGEIITTPFSYVATTSSIIWENCTPVFVDIEANTFCIDPDKIEAAITPRTKAIMPVHVFGNPCNVEKINEIAKKHNLKVIYDAAHAFGVTYKGKSLLDYGDISTCSFHATKLFHTIEGGGIVVKDQNVTDKVELIKRFGHNGDDHFMLGINGKATEFQAAMGLCNLKYIDSIFKERKRLCVLYNETLTPNIQKPRYTDTDDITYNYAYYPILFKNEGQLLQSLEALNRQNIYPRRYFYPSLNTLPYLTATQQCPISEDVSLRIMCLPLYVGLTDDNIKTISEVVNENAR